MHVTIRRYNLNPGHSQQFVTLIQDEFLPLVRQAPKFVSYYALHEGDGVVSTVSMFEDESAAMNSNHLASNWVLTRVGSLISQPPKIISGSVELEAVA